MGLGCGKSGKSNWIAKGGYDTVMFVPATPQSELAQLWRGVVDNFNGPIKVKIVEEGGRTLKSKLQKSNPRKVIGCVELDCLVCTNGRGEGGDCQDTKSSAWIVRIMCFILGKRVNPVI